MFSHYNVEMNEFMSSSEISLEYKISKSTKLLINIYILVGFCYILDVQGKTTQIDNSTYLLYKNDKPVLIVFLIN